MSEAAGVRVNISTPRLAKTYSYKTLIGHVRGSVEKWHLIEPGPIGVAVSGGADSLTLLRVLLDLADDLRIEPVPIYVDQYGGGRAEQLGAFLEKEFSLSLVSSRVDTLLEAHGAIANGHSPCRVCAPIRAEAISSLATSRNLERVALGHHLTDVQATLLMNLLHRGEVDTMRIMTRRRGQNVRIIRPLYFETEACVKANSPMKSAGIFDCGMCSEHATERLRTTQFVNESFSLHPPTVDIVRRLLKHLNTEAGRSAGSRHKRSRR